MSGGRANNGIIEFSGANTPGWISNLGMTYSAGVLTITDAQGDPLTPSNPGWITVPSTTAGQLVTLKITLPVTLNDDVHASSNLTGRTFGVTSGVDWASNLPFFIHVINRGNSNIDGADGSSVFALSRFPSLESSSSISDALGAYGAAFVTDDQQSQLILDSVTIANYTSLPMQLFGMVEMRWATGTTDWTVQSARFAVGAENVRRFLGTNLYTMPTGQNGAATGTHVFTNGGTAPVFTSSNYVYKIGLDNLVTIRVRLSGDGGTDGAGAVTSAIAMPLDTAITNAFHSPAFIDSVVTGNQNVIAQTAPFGNAIVFREAAGTFVENGDFTNGAREISTSMAYVPRLT